MHNNYYFLRQVSKALETTIIGFEVVNCFSQNKNELILELAKHHSSFFIRVNTLPQLSSISFPREFHRTKKNSIDLFDQIKGKKVTSVIQFNNDRSFGLIFNEFTLAILLHGVRSNVVLFQGEEPIAFLNKNLSRGFVQKCSDLNYPIDFSYESFKEGIGDIKRKFPTFDKVILRYLETLNFSQLSIEEQWRIIQELLTELENPVYYLSLIDNKPMLSLLKLGDIKETYNDPLIAANAYFQFFNSTTFFQTNYSKYLNEYESSLRRIRNFILKNKERLNQLLDNNQYEAYANILMANLDKVSLGVESANLFDFYHNSDIQIPLKENLSPQKNAEMYYKKAKNKKLEIANLREIISSKELKLSILEKELEELKSISTPKALKLFIKTREVNQLNEPTDEAKPFKKTEFDGYEILIGKNAKNNDELLQKFTHKDDLWLHAKDVAGSHVILKYKSGKNFPAHIIERAAEIAAFNSKRKTDSHCPVIYTPRKFVRKQKGMAPGAVVIDKEKVIIVTPKGY